MQWMQIYHMMNDSKMTWPQHFIFIYFIFDLNILKLNSIFFFLLETVRICFYKIFEIRVKASIQRIFHYINV